MPNKKGNLMSLDKVIWINGIAYVFWDFDDNFIDLDLIFGELVTNNRVEEKNE